MNTKTINEPRQKGSGISRAVLNRMMQVLVQFLVIGGILFISSGTLNWVWAWAYLGLAIVIVVINAFVLPPELIAERGRPKDNVKTWDKILTTLSAFPLSGALLVSGLDKRFGWSPQISTTIHLVFLVCMALGQGLFTWSMASNFYFSTAVRIQVDRNQTVADGGPYRYIRHPGYVGYITFTLAMPLILGSLWGMIPAGLTACIFVLRTALEDRTLQDELPGYKEYARRVHFRLLPGVW